MSDNEEYSEASDGEEESFYLGTSIDEIEDARRETKAQNLAINKRIKTLEHNVQQEENMKKEHEKDRSQAEKTMAKHVQSKQESSVRMDLDVNLYNGFESQTTNQCTPDSLQEQTQSNKSVKSNMVSLSVEVDEIHRFIVAQGVETRRLKEEARALEQAIEEEGLKEHVEGAESSTGDKKEMLGDVKKRLEQIREECNAAEKLLRQAQVEEKSLHHRLDKDNAKTRKVLRALNSKLEKEMQDQETLKKRLQEAESKSANIMDEIKQIKKLDSTLTDFITQKEEKAKQATTFRDKRMGLESPKTKTGQENTAAQTKKNAASRAASSSKKKLADLQANEIVNDATIIGENRNLTEVRDNAMQKQEKAKKTLETYKPVDRKNFEPEKSRLQELRDKKVKRHNDFKKRQIRVKQLRDAKELRAKECGTSSLDAIRKAAMETANKLEEEKKRLEALKDRRKKRNELLKKLESLKKSKLRLDDTIKIERECKAIQQVV